MVRGVAAAVLASVKAGLTAIESFFTGLVFREGELLFNLLVDIELLFQLLFDLPVICLSVTGLHSVADLREHLETLGFGGVAP